jgi:predicted type IV restriction endonuclease
MTLEEHIAQIRMGIRAGRYANEASVSQGIVLRILPALNWPTYDTQIGCPEYSLEGRRVDFGLCHPASKPIAFIEVKQIGQSEQAERQLFEYAFHVGIPIAILTDGQQWNFFLPGEQGDYGERRVYKLDIVERDAAECVSRLARYLKYEGICSGVAIESARQDYRNVSRERQMLASLPRAWAALIEEEDDLLLELLADRVESLCGYKPTQTLSHLSSRPMPEFVRHNFPCNGTRDPAPLSCKDSKSVRLWDRHT